MIQIDDHMGVSENRGTPKSCILIGFSIVFTIHFGVSLFLETPIFFRWVEAINTVTFFLVCDVGQVVDVRRLNIVTS